LGGRALAGGSLAVSSRRSPDLRVEGRLAPWRAVTVAQLRSRARRALAVVRAAQDVTVQPRVGARRMLTVLNVRRKAIAVLAALLAVAAFGPSAAAPPSTQKTLTIPTGAGVRVSGNVALMRANGGAGETTYNCSCQGGTGTCALIQTPSSLVCDTQKGTTCTGSCDFIVVTTGVSTGIARSATAVSGSRPPTNAP